MKRYVLRFFHKRYFGTSDLHVNYYRFKFQAINELKYFQKDKENYDFKIFKIIRLKPLLIREIFYETSIRKILS